MVYIDIDIDFNRGDKMKVKTIVARNAVDFENLLNDFLSKNDYNKITYNTVSDNGFVIFVAYIEMDE